MKKVFEKIKNRLISKRALRIYAIAAGVFVLVNMGTYFLYAQRPYPNTRVNNKHLGSLQRGKIASRLGEMELVPAVIKLSYKEKSTEVEPESLGIQIDNDQIARLAVNKKHWLPILNFVVSHNISLHFKVDELVFNKKLEELAVTYKQDPTDARIALENGSFSLISEANGYTLDTLKVKDTILSTIGSGTFAIEVPVNIISPAIKQDSLSAALETLQTQQNTSITYLYQGKSKRLTPQEIGAWYELSNGAYVISDSKIKDTVVGIGSSYGIKVQNLSQAVSETKSAIQNKKTLNFTLIKQIISKSYAYCVSLKGVDVSYLPALQGKLAVVYGDPRGWSLEGQIAFSEAASGCNFTVWLSAADQMSSFGGLCDADWSCRIGNNVVINFDRWKGASSAWNAGGGSLEDYRVMVINHETGHWLGFGHKHCSGAGQLAPVMQQQSIDLEGCAFNPWPLVSELTALKTLLKI